MFQKFISFPRFICSRSFFSYFLVVALASCVCGVTDSAHAQKKKKKNKGTTVQESDFTEEEITYSFKNIKLTKNGKKKKKTVTKTSTVACYNGQSGTVKMKKDGSYLFKVFSPKSIKKKIKNNKGDSRKVTKFKSALKNLKAKRKEGNAVCSGGGGTINTSLDPYEGAFGAREAHILFDRFCFAGTPGDIDLAVQQGLEATIARMQTYNPNPTHLFYPGNPSIASLALDAKCDAYLQGEEVDGSDDGNEHTNDPDRCNANNPKDIDLEGLRSRYYLEVFSQNCYHMKLIAWLSDEREAPSLSLAQDDRYRHLAEAYFNDLWAVAQSGDYRDYVRRIFNPIAGSGWAAIVLNVVRNAGGIVTIPNEDGARELNELGTTGYTDRFGNILYGPSHIAQMALALTGWVWSDIDYNIGGEETTSVRAPGFSTTAYYPGDKVLFPGDPVNQTVVQDTEDAIEASLNHSNTPYELAYRMCKEFIAKNCSVAMIKKIGDWVIEDNFNLHTTFARLMRSKALYNSANEKSLVKHPVELYLGHLRAMEFPVGKEPMALRDIEGRLLERTGQRMFLPPSIFGFYEEVLAGEGRVLDRRAACGEIHNQWAMRPGNLEDNNIYSIRDKFMTNLPSAPTDALQVVAKVAKVFNLNLSVDQQSTMAQWLDYYMDSNCSPSEVSDGLCTEEQIGEPYARRDAFDLLDPDVRFEERVQGLLMMVCQLYQYQAK